MHNLLIGIAGGTGSGKTSFALEIMKHFPEGDVVLVDQDSYYKDLSDLPFEERKKVNFDHPGSVDFDKLIEDLKALKNNVPIKKPVYNFVTHTREKDKFTTVVPKKVIILEGIMIFVIPELRELIDIKLYVDTDADVRVLRRIVRDINERGRDLDNIIEQYLNQVKPMHEEFVEPSKRWADLIIPEGAHNREAIRFVVNRIKTLLSE
ncbi:uridine kinase [Thermotomaculum hydrothermale]|uniref:Uridine kinase n=1 Tax=Thermotomaculum hydrothermale TaxID=981385 RepID=A0A7R6SZH3_9BACT|nr:uridine kinase [Thermotomaculum hydrothermale]BBB33661.1 uridine kinase [Thermotomaculum hydrothermale]